MATQIEIAAVGDILMWRRQIASAKVPRKDQYRFDSMFREVAPYLKKADLTIGNLETTLSGRDTTYQTRNPKTGFPMFNCPDELAATLKRAGFDVLTTANNHCMDRGVNGLKRTLNVLDKHGIAHTGTYRSYTASCDYLIKEVKGIRIGILAYTYGTNYIPVPKDQPWLVNRIHLNKMIRDIQHLKSKQADLIIVSLHFGKEFYRYPNQRQKDIVAKLLANGADIILGAHPHVLQPIVYRKIKDTAGTSKRKFAIYSLGNFISQMMWNNTHTLSSVILYLTVQKDDQGQTGVIGFRYVPTWVQERRTPYGTQYRVLPIRKFLKQPDSKLSAEDLQTMRRMLLNTTRHLGTRK